jgi:hypothetical protein
VRKDDDRWKEREGMKMMMAWGYAKGWDGMGIWDEDMKTRHGDMMTKIP